MYTDGYDIRGKLIARRSSARKPVIFSAVGWPAGVFVGEERIDARRGKIFIFFSFVRRESGKFKLSGPRTRIKKYMYEVCSGINEHF